MNGSPVHHLDDDQKRRLVDAFTNVLRQDPDIAFACLYGSLTERQDVHDIDLGVYLKTTPAAEAGDTWKLEARLAAELETATARVAGTSAPWTSA